MAINKVCTARKVCLLPGIPLGDGFLQLHGKDVSGNVWIFGGFGLDSTGEALNYLSDLWKYSGGEWAWMARAHAFSTTTCLWDPRGTRS